MSPKPTVSRFSLRVMADKDFEPIWAELDKRNAVIFIHPCHTPSATWTSSQLPQLIIDYPHETTRATCEFDRQRSQAAVPVLQNHPLACGRDLAVLEPAGDGALLDAVWRAVDAAVAAWGTDLGGCKELFYRFGVD